MNGRNKRQKKEEEGNKKIMEMYVKSRWRREGDLKRGCEYYSVEPRKKQKKIDIRVRIGWWCYDADGGGDDDDGHYIV